MVSYNVRQRQNVHFESFFAVDIVRDCTSPAFLYIYTFGTKKTKEKCLLNKVLKSVALLSESEQIAGSQNRHRHCLRTVPASALVIRSGVTEFGISINQEEAIPLIGSEIFQTAPTNTETAPSSLKRSVARKQMSFGGSKLNFRGFIPSRPSEGRIAPAPARLRRLALFVGADSSTFLEPRYRSRTAAI
ncbi:hypothetical protein EVAR_37571_1 [Eumeta japonica]|uniref:Uncharacterized protein n=1 Tax=Eumeta variegata TaxID=151549 RepID=A0A4C1XV60_EUMVA|nr:hypothetical protein EVAR_37571_1 [Eumeta japonica]